jgi:hypothetical protein
MKKKKPYWSSWNAIWEGGRGYSFHLYRHFVKSCVCVVEQSIIEGKINRKSNLTCHKLDSITARIANKTLTRFWIFITRASYYYCTSLLASSSIIYAIFSFDFRKSILLKLFHLASINTNVLCTYFFLKKKRNSLFRYILNTLIFQCI